MSTKLKITAQKYNEIITTLSNNGENNFKQDELIHVAKSQFTLYSNLILKQFLNTHEFAFMTSIAKCTPVFTTSMIRLLEATAVRQTPEWLEDLEKFKTDCPEDIAIDFRSRFGTEDREAARQAAFKGVFSI